LESLDQGSGFIAATGLPQRGPLFRSLDARTSADYRLLSGRRRRLGGDAQLRPYPARAPPAALHAAPLGDHRGGPAGTAGPAVRLWLVPPGEGALEEPLHKRKKAPGGAFAEGGTAALISGCRTPPWFCP